MPKKSQKNVKNIFYFLKNKYQSVTHVSTPIFQGLFKNIVFRSVALVIKKLWAILDFFFTNFRLFTALYPTLCEKKKIYKKIFQITIYEKSKNFTVIVSQMRVLGQKKLQGGGRQTPLPSLYRVKKRREGGEYRTPPPNPPKC